MTQIKFGIFNYLIADNEALLGTINNTEITDSSADSNAFINPSFTKVRVEITPTIFYNNKYYFVKRVGVCAFRSSNITSVKVGKFVQEIQFRAFDWCSYLIKIEFDPESSLTKIMGSFGVDSRLSEIRFPPFLSYISTYLFTYNTNLRSIYFGGSNIDCRTDYSLNTALSIFVLPNFVNQTLCNHSVTVLSKFPDPIIKSCINNRQYIYYLSHIHIFILIIQ